MGADALSPSHASPSTGAELQAMRRLRAVLQRSSKGLGLAASFVRVFSASKDRGEREAVRRVLLGTPVEKAFAAMSRRGGSPADLLRFVTTLATVSSAEASRGAERLSSMFDRWTLLRERRAMERKVMAFRGTVIAAVSGVVVGMISSLAPVVSNFQVTLAATPQPASGFSPYEGAVFLVPSALCLGVFLSPDRPYVNLALSLASFVGVVYLLGPMASFGLG